MVHQFRQPGFRGVKPAADVLGDRQAEQRHHAVGLDLDQTLYRPACLALGQRNIEDQEARKAVVDLEVGEYPGSPVGNLRADHLATTRRALGEYGLRLYLFYRVHFDMGGDHQLAGYGGQPLGDEPHRMRWCPGAAARRQLAAGKRYNSRIRYAVPSASGNCRRQTIRCVSELSIELQTWAWQSVSDFRAPVR